MPSHLSRHLQRHFFLPKLLLEYVFYSSNTMLKLLVILLIILLFSFGSQKPMGLMKLMNGNFDWPHWIRVWILNKGKFQSRISHWRCSINEVVLKSFSKFTVKHLCQSLFYQKEIPIQMFSGEYLEIFKNGFFNRTPRGDFFCYSLYFRAQIVVLVILSKIWSQLSIHK